MFSTIKQKLEALWNEVTGDAKAEVEQALSDAEAELGKVAPLLTQFRSDVKAAVAAAEPAIASAVEALVEKLLQDAGGLLGQDIAGK